MISCLQSGGGREKVNRVTMSSNKEVIGGTSGSVQSEKAIKTLSNTFTTLYEGDLKELNEKLDQFR